MHFGDFADVALSAILKSSQVQTIVDYAKLSPSSDQPIVLALKKFIPCYAAELCIKTPSALLALCRAPHKANSGTESNLEHHAWSAGECEHCRESQHWHGHAQR